MVHTCKYKHCQAWLLLLTSAEADNVLFTLDMPSPGKACHSYQSTSKLWTCYLALYTVSALTMLLVLMELHHSTLLLPNASCRST